MGVFGSLNPVAVGPGSEGLSILAADDGFLYRIGPGERIFVIIINILRAANIRTHNGSRCRSSYNLSLEDSSLVLGLG